MESKKVYVLENRGHPILYHYLIFMIAGLEEFAHLPKPVYFHTPIEQPFQKEIVALLEPDFQHRSQTYLGVSFNHFMEHPFEHLIL
jgi:hypothetical protein